MKIISMTNFLLIILFSASLVHAQSIVINEVMASNSKTISDEDGDTPDWIELVNNSPDSIDLNGFSLSDDPGDPSKWIFPGLSLEPHQFLLIFASGKNRREWLHWETVIDWGDLWRYRLGTSEPPSNWRSIGFDDSQWYEGVSGFGYGDNDDATKIPNVISLCIRKTFTVAAQNNISKALLHIDYDDAFVAYLNDVEIARSNIGIVGDHPAFNQPAITYKEAQMYQSGAPDRYILNDVQSLFKTGKNVLAIQVHNSGIESSDFSAIPFLTIGFNTRSAGVSRGMSPFLPSMTTQLHTNFKINASGEHLTLHNSQGQLSDQVDTGNMPGDISYGRKPDGSSNWFYFTQPTPAKPNTNMGYPNIAGAPVFSNSGGFYNPGFMLTLTASFSQASVYYTLDGSVPTTGSNLYQSPIVIYKTTVVRAREVVANYLPGPVVTHTFFINENLKLPVISLATAPPNLWDPDSGIYVLGRNYDSNPPNWGANFWQDWEKPVHVEFFEPDRKPGFCLDAGIKIFGGWSRASPQKPVAIYARSDYGASEIDYQIFPDKPITKFESFVLRNSGNDWYYTLFRDAMMQLLLEDTDLDIQAYRPAVVFLNGAYWGIHNIREKISEHYLAAHRGIDPDNIDLLENDGAVIKGDAAHYQALLNYIATHDMKLSASYDAVKTMMDVDNFLDYEIAQIYFDNSDWPGNNIKFWRPRTAEGRWKWIVFDTDFGFGLYNAENYRNNTLAFATEPNGPDWPNPPWSTFLLRKLLENGSFRIEFINRFADHLNVTFQAERVNAIIDSIKALIASDMPRHRTKWRDSAQNWDNNVRVLKQFANLRGSFLKAHLMQKFQVKSMIKLTLDVSPSNQGRIKINSLVINSFPWSGYYFKDVPLQIIAIPKPGYRFARWSENSVGTSACITVQPAQDLSIIARWEKQGNQVDPIVINEINYHSAANFNPEDWIEFYNAMDSPVDLSGWIFKDENDAHIFTFPTNTILDAKGFLVLCANRMAFASVFPAIQNVIGDLAFGLNNAGETVRLFDDQGQIIDSLTLDDNSPWPTEPDGNGATLELKDPSLDNSLAGNWAASGVLGGTPGRVNSAITQVENKSGQISEFSLAQNYPNPFNFSTSITYYLPEPGFVTITIFNVGSQTVATLVNDERQAGRHRVEWNAQVDGALSSGIYFYKLVVVSKNHRFSEIKKMLYQK